MKPSDACVDALIDTQAGYKEGAIDMETGTAFKKILVGFNGTSGSSRAAEVAISLARSLNAKLILLGVVPPLTAEAQAEGLGLEEASGTRRRLEEQLEATASRVRSLGADVVTEIADGEPEAQIERKAEEEGVDLIIVGRREIGRVRHWLEGSTSETLVRSAHASVLVVHEDSEQP
ncbi:MAG: universal stress protein [Acidobacteria bacterium]|nr:universal stress protein [Acidobacteriota bacterium]